ncbi:LysR family transcriptional regulator [Ruegeria sp. THAF57]|uniref:LysR family transcriptional regulator n=1 Tax=Ruegeria sp. THAF57 TaxID=2744555 RepID=UPI002106F288|nr:LysR family transcriptional regulator [Ruegeria sp. THAF57]
MRSLLALSAVSRHGSFSGASQELNLTSPAVHTQLKNLEEIVDTPLIIRNGSGPMKATEAGQILVAAAARINSELEKSMRDIEALREGKKGHIRLGVISTGKYFAPSLVADLNARHPDIEIDLAIGNREQILAMLDAKALHLAIMGRPPKSPKLVSAMIGSHPYILIANPEHPLAGLSAVSSEALLQETFIAREEGSGTRMLMARYLDDIGAGQSYRVSVMGGNETIKQAVIAGLGIAMLSKHTVMEELKTGRLVSLNLNGLPLHRHWHLIQPLNIPDSPAAKTIWDEICEMEGNFLPR